VAVPDEPASPFEVRLAYAAAVLASLVWVGCVLPGATLSDPAASPDAATPMARGALLILPALILLVAGPVGTILARGSFALRALLSAGEAAVTLFVAGAIWHARVSDRGVLAASGVFVLLGLLAVADTVATLRAGARAESDEPASPPPRPPFLTRPDLRLAIAILALLLPASLLERPGYERASLLVPFFYVAVSSAGCRFARGEGGLRLVGSVLFALVAAHLVVAIRYVLVYGQPPSGAWTWEGRTTFAMAWGILGLAGARALWLVRKSFVAWRAARGAA
jgi:hypothetical protein